MANSQSTTPSPCESTGSCDHGTRRHHGGHRVAAELLRTTVSGAVPLRIAELGRQLDNGAVSVDALLERARAAGQIIAEHGDVLLFRGKRPGESARVFVALVDALAIGALLVEGGSQFLGEYWCAPYKA